MTASIKQALANRRRAKILQKQKRGLWGRTPEQISATSRTTYAKGRGLAGMSEEERLAASRKGGLNNDRQYLGGLATSRIKGALSAAGKIGGRLGGVTQGNINAANGHLDYARHIRYHVLRDRLPNSKYCKFCDGTIAYA